MFLFFQSYTLFLDKAYNLQMFFNFLIFDSKEFLDIHKECHEIADIAYKLDVNVTDKNVLK